MAQYQAGDTIQIAAIDYSTDTIEAEWNATNVTSVPGKNVPTELDGRIVIGNPKTGSTLGYPIYVGSGGGTFVLTIDYKGFSGASAEGYMYLWVDDGAQDKIWLRTEGWNMVASNAFQLSPGFHTIYTQYKGSSGAFNIDRFLLDAVEGSLQEKQIKLISAFTYETDTFQMEDFDATLSSISAGKCTIEGINPSYITNIQGQDILTFPFRVGAGGGMFDFSYHYKKLASNADSIVILLDDSVLGKVGLASVASVNWEDVSASASIRLSPGYHEIKIAMQGSNAHQADYFALAPVANSLFTANPKIWATPADHKRIMYNIENYNWANGLLSMLKSKIASRVKQHKEDPEYLCSRIPRTWGSCSNYTDATISVPPQYSGNAAIPTLHRATYGLRVKTVEGARCK